MFGQQDSFYLVIAALVAVILIVVVVWQTASWKVRKKLTYMLDSLEDGELNFRFSTHSFGSRKINSSLNRIRALFDKVRLDISEREAFYFQMLDHVNTGVVALGDSGSVLYCNSKALSLLGFATFTNVRQLRIISDTLYDCFAQVQEAEQEKKVSFYDERGERLLVVSATHAVIDGRSLKIVVFNDVSKEIAQSEEIAWSKLIRVLTHEIMNTVTPIATLSESFAKYETFDAQADSVRAGMRTIAASSKGLVKFVDSYRTLARVASPVKKAFLLRELMERVLELVSPLAQESGATCTYKERVEDILLYADESQISQIILNIVKNALQASATVVEIVAELNYADCVIINIINNGIPIPQESQSQIFIPFFTTKQGGTGIGLSLSRQVMRLHNGYISLTKSVEGETIFTLLFG